MALSLSASRDLEVEFAPAKDAEGKQNGGGVRGSGRTDKNVVSLHGEQAALRRAIAELIFFAGVNDIVRCTKIVDTWSIPVASCFDYDRRTPLHVAAAEGSFTVCEWLLERGCNVNALDRFNRTSLEEAARGDHVELVKMLVRQGGKIWEEGNLVDLEHAKVRDLVNWRRAMLTEFGLEDQWEIRPADVKLLEKLGEGEFGEVFRGQWHGTPVAVKQLKRSDEIAIGDFRTEMTVLRKVHHPNCVQFLGACTRSAPYFIVTELMACSLADVFRTSINMPSRRRQVEIALDFARGMAHLHARRQPIIHRDLKPANLMVGGNPYSDLDRLLFDTGVVKIADFGLSKSLPRLTKHPELHPIALTDKFNLTGETGSYRYMAPEVFRHEPYNSKVDVYGFSMIMYQLLEWQLPFQSLDATDAARMAALNDLRPSWPTLPSDSIQQELRSLVESCWAALPDNRPSFEDVTAKLARVLEQLGPHEKWPMGPPGCCAVQ